jgi:4-amino-4-deoxy-L-arabinose transferase-like glycosyltransferase
MQPLLRRQLVRHQLWIVLAAAVVFFTNLGATYLWDQDETLHATCAREMFQRGDWVVPTFNGEYFFDKPPLMFWCMICGFEWFGVTEFAARFWSAVFGIGTALATYHLGRLLFRAEVGFWGGLIVASSLLFTVSARAATVDSALVFFTTCAMLALVAGGMARQRETAGGGSGGQLAGPAAPALLPRSWICFVLMYACLGVAVLGKGPIGVVLPVAVLGLFVLIAGDLLGAGFRAQQEGPMGSLPARACPAPADKPPVAPAPPASWAARFRAAVRPFGLRKLLLAAWRLRPLTGLLVVLAIALPWYVLVGLRTDGAWLKQFFGEHNLQRALHAREGHSGPIFYYIPAIMIGFFPWSLFIVPSVILLVRRIRRRDAWQVGCVFLACWIGLPVVFWSLVRTKLPHYVLPVYPALALMTGAFIHDWLRRPAEVRRSYGRNAMAALVLVGIGAMVAMPILASFFLPGEGAIGLVGLVLVAGGVVGLAYLRRGRRDRAMAAFAITSVVFLVGVFGFAAMRVSRHENAVPMLAEINQACPGPPDLITYGFRRESVVFYAGHAIPHCQDAARLAALVAGARHPWVITGSEYEKQLEKAFPGEFSVVSRRPKFLKRGEVLVLAWRSAPDAPHTAGRRGSERRR